MWAQEVVTRWGGQDVTVVNTHLTTGDGSEQTRELFDIATAVDGPVVVAVDLNQEPDELAGNADDYDLDAGSTSPMTRTTAPFRFRRLASRRWWRS